MALRSLRWSVRGINGSWNSYTKASPLTKFRKFPSTSQWTKMSDPRRAGWCPAGLQETQSMKGAVKATFPSHRDPCVPGVYCLWTMCWSRVSLLKSLCQMKPYTAQSIRCSPSPSDALRCCSALHWGHGRIRGNLWEITLKMLLTLVFY